MRKIVSSCALVVLLTGIATTQSGCWLVAAGAGAEAGYVAAQDDRTASETLTDQRITSTIKSKLLADSEVSGLDINVDTFKGNVTLRGFVRDANEEQEAIRLAQETSGVRSVNSKITLQ